MNTHDKLELPPLPSPTHRGYGLHYNADEMESYAIAAIEADRKRRGEVVVTKTPEGEIIAVTRQDDEGKILSVIAEADRKRRGEPVDVPDALRQIAGWMDDGGPSKHEAEMIGMALSGPVGCSSHQACTKAAKLAFLEAARIWERINPVAPQPAEPVKVPSDADLFTIHDEHFPTMVLGHDNYLRFARALLARYGGGTP